MAPGTSRITRPPGPPAQTGQAAGASPRRWSHLRARFTPERLALTVFTLAVVAVVAAPLVEVVLRSFQQQTGLVGSTWSTANYRQLSSAQILKSAENSAIIAVGTTAIATVSRRRPGLAGGTDRPAVPPRVHRAQPHPVLPVTADRLDRVDLPGRPAGSG